MKIACLCVTFNRAAQLAEAVESFLRQTYPAELRELVILDDAGQYDPAACDHLRGVKLITTRHRFRTLGEKRNATPALASPDVEAYAVWDDDDIYLPWHLEATAQVFAAGIPWSRPAEVWIDRRTHLERKPTGGLFHGSWGFTRDAFLSVGGYPAMQSGQDQALAGRFKKSGIKPVSPSELAVQSRQRTPTREIPQQHSLISDTGKVLYGARRDRSGFSGDKSSFLATQSIATPADNSSLLTLPSYIYRWYSYPHARHISGMGKDGYQRRGDELVEHLARVSPCWSRDWPALVAGFK